MLLFASFFYILIGILYFIFFAIKLIGGGAFTIDGLLSDGLFAIEFDTFFTQIVVFCFK